MKRLAFLSLVFATSCGGSTTPSGQPGATGSPAHRGTDSPAHGPTGATSQAGVEMTFSGFYDVPVPPELAAAATYAAPEVHWTVANGQARLEYDLPVGLVGGHIEVAFVGSFDPNADKQHLAGPAGTAECTLTAKNVSCFEVMRGLLPIVADMSLVEAAAKQDYAGPIQDRIDVTQRFIGDPLGIVRFELATGVVEEADEDSDHD